MPTTLKYKKRVSKKNGGKQMKASKKRTYKKLSQSLKKKYLVIKKKKAKRGGGWIEEQKRPYDSDDDDVPPIPSPPSPSPSPSPLSSNPFLKGRTLKRAVTKEKKAPEQLDQATLAKIADENKIKTEVFDERIAEQKSILSHKPEGSRE